MSKTSLRERNKAIRLAWEREQELVSEGKGTRDWSQEQQKDILDPEKGKAYDENGRAFEGQHMKSAAEYPEYQGDPNNIQFLTKEEHLDAHKGSWQNPTNWYYNPDTKEFVDFGEKAPTPCEAISLSEPVRNSVIDKQEGSDGIKGPSKTKEATSERKQTPRQESASLHSENTSQKKKAAAPPPPEVHESFGDKILHVVDVVREFGEKHPVLTGIVKWGGAAAAAIATAAIANENSSGRNASEDGDHDSLSSLAPSDDDSILPNNDCDYGDSSDSSAQQRERPYTPNDVPAGGQHYNTKNGRVWREKQGYHREGKHNDND